MELFEVRNDETRVFYGSVTVLGLGHIFTSVLCVEFSQYRGADKSLARPTLRRILFDGENISFDASIVIYINNINIPPIMIINRIYETQNLLSL